ncbi:hypothetical protein MMC30_005532 [Trapelia coarctata]|nr:hypothetical protein [Trapelia coarctata]
METPRAALAGLANSSYISETVERFMGWLAATGLLYPRVKFLAFRYEGKTSEWSIGDYEDKSAMAKKWSYYGWSYVENTERS